MVDGVFVRSSRVGTPNDVEAERRLRPRSVTRPAVSLRPFEPDAIEISVLENVEEVVHVLVGRLDRVGLDALDAGSEVRQFALHVSIGVSCPVSCGRRTVVRVATRSLGRVGSRTNETLPR